MGILAGFLFLITSTQADASEAGFLKLQTLFEKPRASALMPVLLQETPPKKEDASSALIETLKSKSLAAREKAAEELIRSFSPVLEKKLREVLEAELKKDGDQKFISRVKQILQEGPWTPEMRELGKKLSWELRQMQPHIVEAAFSASSTTQLSLFSDLSRAWSLNPDLSAINEWHEVRQPYFWIGWWMRPSLGYLLNDEDRLNLFYAARGQMMKQHGNSWVKVDPAIKVFYLATIQTGRYMSKEALSDIAALVCDTDASVRAAALGAWRDLPVEDAVKVEGAALMLKDVNANVRASAVDALTTLRAKKYAPQIRKMKENDESPVVRLACEIFELIVGSK